MSTPPEVLTDYYRRRAAEEPDAPAYFSLHAGRWLATSWGAFMHGAEALARRLAALQLPACSRLGVMVPTGLDWETVQVGALLGGHAIVGLDAHDQPARLADIIQVSELAALVVGDAASFARIPDDACAKLAFVLCLNDDPAPAGCRPRWLARREFDALDGVSAGPGPAPGTVATIIFTSGSTGAPKGIAYSHAQVCLAVAGILDAFPDIDANDRLVCWLPLSNLFQRMINFCAAGRGAQTYFVADPRSIMTQLPSIRPQVFIAVPRFFEKLNEGIEQQLTRQSPGARRLVRWAIGVGARVAQAQRDGHVPDIFTRLQFALADRLVLRRLRALLGGEIRFMVSGSAPFPRWLIEKFHALGLLVLEAYGISENVVPIAVNRTTDFEFGTVGRVLAGNEVTLADDGEVLVRGLGVFGGYLGQPGVDSPLGPDGVLHTGDLGEWTPTGRLRLTGRKSEVFKTSTGRKIAPTAVEARLKQIPGIDHVVVFGAARKAIVALVTPSLDLAPTLRDDAAFTQYAERIAAQVAAAVADDADYLRPAGLLVHRHAFTIDSGELTGNLKLRRKVIEARHGPALDALFDRIDSGGRFVAPVAPDTLMLNC